MQLPEIITTYSNIVAIISFCLVATMYAKNGSFFSGTFSIMTCVRSTTTLLKDFKGAEKGISQSPPLKNKWPTPELGHN